MDKEEPDGNAVKKKLKTALQALGLLLLMNAGIAAFLFIMRWVFTSRFGVWLELNKRNRPYVPGTIYFAEFFLVVIAVWWYLDKVKRDKGGSRSRPK